jgi:asparagine synthetase B (glutamine-hydrolysing)
VRLHLRADGPVRAWLSGGVDSSAVVALARRIAGPLPTFTLGFDEPAYDETRDQRTLDRVPGQELPNERIACSRQLLERYPEALWHAESPSSGVLDLLRLALSESSARRVKVVLTGEGADEVLGGYRWFHTDRLAHPLAALPRPLRRAIALIPLGERTPSGCYSGRGQWASSAMRGSAVPWAGSRGTRSSRRRPAGNWRPAAPNDGSSDLEEPTASDR